ncbi:NADH-quinone oxidoreductase subunit M [Actinophytocola sp.]|uniref:complex I subunit 4 family protein n=1 Tax=Actinophytocola sp. TaxID=1872138 RepID=UPI002D664075|nr:NADH-quinone oxidoreductase subunit M [Actinophytocola sp.]HYQ63461.1 NADH-quinone oxidoreductase subunit M [Actinophytocola sp.]
MLSIVVFLPVAVAVALLVAKAGDAVVRWAWVGASAVELVLVVVLWLGYDGPGYGYEVNRRWIPTVSSGYHLGVDGLSLPLVAVTAVLFLACAIYALRRTGSGTGREAPSGPRQPDNDRIRSFAALFLFLETVCMGVFVSLDLVLFFVFFDLSIVGMYFVIAGWGHRNAARAALQFFLYTFLGSLALLLGFIGLYLAAAPHTFDMVQLTAQNPLQGKGTVATLVLVAIGVGLAIKTPTVPFHTWLPPAHTEAPAEGSAILAGVLLKLGTYGFVRIAMPMLPDAWRDWAGVVVAVGVVSVLYGALVALAQRDFKRMVAYTSVNHMGYVVLAVGAAGLLSTSDPLAHDLAVAGAVTQMVSHGLITGALFLLAGVLYERGGTYDLDAYGGIAAGAPRFAGLTAVAAFASLGLPGFSGFVAEFQILTGSLPGAPVATALAFLGILVTAALFLRAYQRLFLGEPAGGVGDLTVTETLSIAPLMALAVVLGLFPRFLLDLVEPAARVLGTLVRR